MSSAAASVLPVLRVGSIGVWEGDAGSAGVVVPVDLSQASASLVTVKYSVHSSDAVTGIDFVARTGSLSFPAGATSRKVTVTVYGNTTLGANKHIAVTLNAAVGAVIGTGNATVTIRDDDTPGGPTGLRVAVGNATVIEADGGAHYAYLPLTLSAPATTQITVTLALDCGTALAGTDYSGGTKTVTFAAGQRAKTLTYKIFANTTPETMKSFFEKLSVKIGPVAIDAGEGGITIVDNDAGTGSVGTIERASIASDGTEATQPLSLSCGDLKGSFTEGINSDGRYVLFSSSATNLFPNDTNDQPDLFVRDTLTNTTQHVNLDGAGSSIDAQGGASISADGRYVLFPTRDPAWLSGGAPEVLLRHDRLLGSTVLASIDPGGATVSTVAGSISGDGRYVAFRVGGPSTSHGDVPMYVRDVLSGTTLLAGSASRVSFGAPQISADARFVAFASDQTTLVANDTNNLEDIFVRDLQTGAVDRVSLNHDGAQETPPAGTFDYGRSQPSISADGRFVAYYTLTSAESGPHGAVMLRDRIAGTSERIDSDGYPTTNATRYSPRVSNDGRFVLYESVDVSSTQSIYGLYLLDRTAGTTTRVDVPADGSTPDGDQQSFSTQLHAALSGNGQFAAFDSFSSNLVAGDTNDLLDVFLARVS